MSWCRKMNILLIHNYYQLRGGEDVVFQAEADLLKNNGNSVNIYSVNNDNVVSLFTKIFIAIFLPFNVKQYFRLKRYLLKTSPDIVHIHNYFPILSPSIFYACKSVGVPVVHTLHNYRAVCPTAVLMHNGMLDERSVKGSSWWGVVKKVYRNSFFGSLSLVVMIEMHKLLGTWRSKVDRFIVMSEFSKGKYIDSGWPEHKVAIKPNFIFDHSWEDSEVSEGYCLFVGRLSEEKGIETLLNSWQNISSSLKIVGDGPMKDYVKANLTSSIEYLGQQDKDHTLSLVKNASFIIIPSICYETFGMVVVEAFLCGTPVLVSRLGSFETLVDNHVTGLHFNAGDANDLSRKAQWLIDNPESAREMGKNARNEYLSKYTPEKNYEMLMDIYKQAIEEAKKS